MVSNKDELLLRLKLLEEAIGEEIGEQENIINGTKTRQILIDEFELGVDVTRQILIDEFKRSI